MDAEEKKKKKEIISTSQTNEIERYIKNLKKYWPHSVIK